MTYDQRTTDDGLPPHYEKALQSFGERCIEKFLKTPEKFTFSRYEILKVMPESLKHSRENVIMGFLIKSNTSFTRSIFNVGDCYQPIHKTFLEFVAAYYLQSLGKVSKIHGR